MNQLRIPVSVYELLISKLLCDKHICFIGGSKCGKSRVANELLKRLEKKYSKPKITSVPRITGVSKAVKYSYAGLDKPVLFLKNVSGLSLLTIEDLFEDYYIISTFPVLSVDLLFNRFIAFDDNHTAITNYESRLWKCLPTIAENKKLGDGNVYIINIYNTKYKDGCIEKENLCNFIQDTSLCEGEFSRVIGKYSIAVEEEPN